MTNGEVNTGNLRMDMPATGLLLTFIYVLSVLVLYGLATITVLGTDLGQFAFWAAAGSLWVPLDLFFADGRIVLCAYKSRRVLR